VRQELQTYESKIATHEKMALRKAVDRAAAQARQTQSEKYDLMAEQVYISIDDM